jgi:molybdopterin-biosynthesis enzyme MoeA-like protein
MYRFYALIIGSEILNGRRQDAHFTFVRDALQKRGYALYASFVIQDDPALITRTVRFIAEDPEAVLFSFGGVGSTPDDHTRRCAAEALKDGKLYKHETAARIIEETLGERAYPHPIRMAMLPKDAELIDNPVNNMPAFSLDGRFFFMPGFPEMSHPMVESILDRLVPSKRPYFRKTLTAACRENEFIELMEAAPSHIEISSLPKLSEDGWFATLSVAGEDETEVEVWFDKFRTMLEKKGIDYRLSEA